MDWDNELDLIEPQRVDSIDTSFSVLTRCFALYPRYIVQRSVDQETRLTGRAALYTAIRGPFVGA